MFDLDSSQVNPRINQGDISGGNDSQIASEQTTLAGATARQPSLSDDVGYSGQVNSEPGTGKHVGEASAELNASEIDILRNTPEELFFLRHYSECIAPWYGLLTIYCMIIG